MVAHPALPPDPSVEPHEAGPAGPQNQYPAEGLPVFLVNHRPHKRAHEDVWYCDECGKEVAQYLKEVLKIGSGELQSLSSWTFFACLFVLFDSLLAQCSSKK